MSRPPHCLRIPNNDNSTPSGVKKPPTPRRGNSLAAFNENCSRPINERGSDPEIAVRHETCHPGHQNLDLGRRELDPVFVPGHQKPVVLLWQLTQI